MQFSIHIGKEKNETMSLQGLQKDMTHVHPVFPFAPFLRCFGAQVKSRWAFSFTNKNTAADSMFLSKLGPPAIVYVEMAEKNTYDPE